MYECGLKATVVITRLLEVGSAFVAHSVVAAAQPLLQQFQLLRSPSALLAVCTSCIKEAQAFISLCVPPPPPPFQSLGPLPLLRSYLTRTYKATPHSEDAAHRGGK